MREKAHRGSPNNEILAIKRMPGVTERTFSIDDVRLIGSKSDLKLETASWWIVLKGEDITDTEREAVACFLNIRFYILKFLSYKLNEAAAWVLFELIDN